MAKWQDGKMARWQNGKMEMKKAAGRLPWSYHIRDRVQEEVFSLLPEPLALELEEGEVDEEPLDDESPDADALPLPLLFDALPLAGVEPVFL